MLTTAPHLRIRRPSPTTAEFTVTTLPPPTLPLQLLHGFLVLVRIVLSVATLLLLHARWSLSPLAAPLPARPGPRPPLLTDDMLWYVLQAWQRSAGGKAFVDVAAGIPLPVLLPAAALAFFLLSRRGYKEEGLLVLRGLGVQTSESAESYLATTATRFIPTEKIQDILINEAFYGFEVRYYLIVIVEGEEDVVVVFPGLLPPRQIVEEVWRGVRGCLYEGRIEEKGQVV